ncbi:MAG: alpha/beta hydrolase [Betaproteobacteria bacterium]
MNEPVLEYLHCLDSVGGHRMGYWQWGHSDAQAVVLCVHGLTRQGRDFDVLARALLQAAQGRGHSLRLICPDLAGRGSSDRLGDPALYQPLTYLADLQALLAHLHAQVPMATLDWVGTSLGGIIGMLAAAQPQALPQPIRRLLLNDVGPQLSWAGLARIKGYVGQGGPFDSLQAGIAALRLTLAGFGPHTDEQWHALNAPMFKQAADGRWVFHYDPAIALPFASLSEASNQQGGQFMQAVYEQITAKTLRLRGAHSELLSRANALAMTGCGPRARLLELAGVGHAPTLITAEQVEPVLEFLLRP